MCVGFCAQTPWTLGWRTPAGKSAPRYLQDTLLLNLHQGQFDSRRGPLIQNPSHDTGESYPALVTHCAKTLHRIMLLKDYTLPNPF